MRQNAKRITALEELLPLPTDCQLLDLKRYGVATLDMRLAKVYATTYDNITILALDLSGQALND